MLLHSNGLSCVFVPYLGGFMVPVCVGVLVCCFGGVEFNAKEADVFVGKFHAELVVFVGICERSCLYFHPGCPPYP